MAVRIIGIISLILFLSGCAVQPYRASKIRYQHPDWDDATIQKIAARKVEVGMNSEMVRAAIGIPDAISRNGDQEKWGYAILEGDYEPRKEFVFFVYFKYGLVAKISGDRGRLAYLSWYD